MSDIFNHEADAWDSLNDEDDERNPYPGRMPRCNRCGSTDVRWRQQGGRWVLFSSKPGVEHVCPITDDFEVLP
jgi:hypothetical protein